MSSANFVAPTHFERASTLRKGFPTTFKSCARSAWVPSSFLTRPLPFPSCPLLVAIDALSRQLQLFAAHLRGGQLDRLVDFDVAGAAAEVAAEGLFDLVAGGRGVLREQLLGDEEEAGRAVAALRGAGVGEGLLQGVQAVLGRHAFDRLDAAFFGVEAEHEAREHRAAVHEHGAGAALAQLAAVLRAGQGEVFAQHLQKRLVRREGDLGLLTVEGETDVCFLSVGHLSGPEEAPGARLPQAVNGVPAKSVFFTGDEYAAEGSCWRVCGDSR